MEELRDNQKCFVCGAHNPSGLGVQFRIDTVTRSIQARFIPSVNHQGYEGIVHGGILSALLDEAMAKLAFSLGIPAVTAEMTVRFKSPAAPGEELDIYGKLGKETHRIIYAEAEIRSNSRVLAEASGKLLRVS